MNISSGALVVNIFISWKPLYLNFAHYSWNLQYPLYQSSILTTSQANTIDAFEVLACGNPTHNLEVVSTPKQTTITLLLAMSIFSQSRLGVCERLYPFQCYSLIVMCFPHPYSSDIVNNNPSVLDLGPQLYGKDILAGVFIFPSPLFTLAVCMHSLMVAVPCFSQVLSASKSLLRVGLCDPSKLISVDFSWTTQLYFCSFLAWLSAFFSLIWFLDFLTHLSFLWHINTLPPKSSMAYQRP